MSQRLWKAARAAVIAVALAGSAAPAAPVPTEAKPGESPVSKARKALDQKITAKAEGKTLTEAIELLKDIAKVDIALDTSTIQMLGMDPDQAIITFDFKGVTLKEGLKTAFASMNLRCGVTATGIVVSTDEGLTVRQLRHRVNLDIDGKSLAEVLKSLAEESGASVSIDPRAKKAAEEKITLKLDDAPLESAVRLAANVGGLSVVRMSNLLFVTTDANAEKLRPDADKPVGPTPGNPIFGGVERGFGAPGGGAVPLPEKALPPPSLEITPPEVKK